MAGTQEAFGDEKQLYGGVSPRDEQGDTSVVDLADIGLEKQTAYYIGPFEILSEGYNICSSWAAMSATLVLVLGTGGSVTLLYGLILVFFMIGCVVLTLAELASVYPSAGGQYHWTSILAPKSCSRALSYTCGIINVYSWIAIAAGVAIIIPQFILGIVLFYDTSYTPERWHYFVIYQVVNILVILYNIFAIRRSMWVFNVAFGLSLALFFVVLITCVTRSTTKQSSEFVWTEFTNETGWNSRGVVFFIGILNPTYIYAGIDGAIHLAEECANAATAVPRALLSTWLIGFITSFGIAVAVLYSVSDYEAVLSTKTGVSVYEIYFQATRSRVAPTVFVAILLMIAPVALSGIEQTASRLTWAFARDNALVFSKQLGHMNEKLEAPVWALVANGFVILIIGCIYLGSSTAFNAFIGTAVILQLLTFAIPAALLMFRKRSARFLPSNRKFKVPSPIGWAANFFTVAFALICLVFFDFPTVLPVTGSNMNYSCVVLGVMGLFAVINWFLWARKHFHGPTMDMI